MRNSTATYNIKTLSAHFFSGGESAELYRQLIQGLPAAVYTCDAQGFIMIYNKAAEVLWGRKPEIGKDLWCGSWRIYGKDVTPLPLDFCPMAIALKEGRPVKGEEIIIERPDGVRRNVLPHPEPIFDSKGKVIGAVNMLVDITDHKRTEKALLESEERFRTMADQAPIMIWMSDEKSNCIYLNSKWSQFTGMPAANGYGKGWVDFVNPEDKESTYQQWQQAFQNRQAYESKFRYRNTKGEYRIITSNFCPRINEAGDFMGYVGILNDITLLENAKTVLEDVVEERTKDLNNINAELERSNLELEHFAYVASHDLQEPLRKISTFNSLILDNESEKLSDKAKDYFNRTIAAANRMQKFINDLLSYSRTKTNLKDLEKIDLNKVVKEIKISNKEIIEKQKAVIETTELPVVHGVPFQIQQLMENLISNALKYFHADRTPHIAITSEIVQHMERNTIAHHGFYKISVMDNGIGFHPEYAEKIFQIFCRLHGTVEYPGSGIGLAICKKIVDNHDGFIHANAIPGAGATFEIFLPIRDVNE